MEKYWGGGWILWDVYVESAGLIYSFFSHPERLHINFRHLEDYILSFAALEHQDFRLAMIAFVLRHWLCMVV